LVAMDFILPRGWLIRARQPGTGNRFQETA
jgi:hypothetical protein